MWVDASMIHVSQVIPSVQHVEAEGFLKQCCSLAVVPLCLQGYPSQCTDGIGVFLHTDKVRNKGASVHRQGMGW